MPGLVDKLGPLIRIMGVSEVIRRSGVDSSTIYRFLDGEQNLNEKKLHAIAHAVGCRVVVQLPAAIRDEDLEREMEMIQERLRERRKKSG